MSAAVDVIPHEAGLPSSDLKVPPGTAPRLLVSVRTADEARVAIASGVDLLDCKEPQHGALGRPAATTIREIIAARDELAPRLPVSVALGELREWSAWDSQVAADGCVVSAEPHAATLTQLLHGETSPQLVKLGLAGTARNDDWRGQWNRLRAALDAASLSPVIHVAVCYADWPLAAAPSPDDVVSAAIETGCGGVLFDTWSKSQGNLPSLLPTVSLAPLLERIRRAGLFSAVAGRLQIQDLRELRVLSFDVLAVRGAVCETNDRSRSVSADRIMRLRAAIQQHWR